MEKRAVVLDDEVVKTSSSSKSCPQCGRALEEESYCNSCGTKPFEKRPPPKK